MNPTETVWVLETLRAWLRDRDAPLVCPDTLRPEALGADLAWNRLAPLFHTLPVAWPQTGVWSPFRAQLAAAYARSLMQALRQLTSGTVLMQALDADGIPSLAVRGPFLALAAYSDPGARFGADIDILIPRTARRHAWRVCHRLGYASLEWEAPLWPLDAHRIHWRIQRRDDPVTCELHWTLEPSYGAMTLRYAEFFERARRVAHGGFAWRQPCPEHLFLLECLHIGRHVKAAQSAAGTQPDPGASGAAQAGILFRWLDLACLLRDSQGPFDWDWVARQARDRRVCRSLVAGLLGVQNGLGTALPVEAAARLPGWEDALAAQASSPRRQHVEQWCKRRAAPTLGLAETSMSDVLYFLAPPRGFFAPSRGIRLGVQRMGHTLHAGTVLAGAGAAWSAFAAVTAWRRRHRRTSAPRLHVQPVAAGGAP